MSRVHERPTSKGDEDQSRESIENLIHLARQKYGRDDPPIKSLVDTAQGEIKFFLNIMDPKEYYQWFCQIWQSFEYLYSFGTDENSWLGLVGKFAASLTERDDESIAFSHPSLRAMCMSFMLNSLNPHPKSQAYALRMLILFSTRTDLIKDEKFVHWILNFMVKRIDSTIEIKDGRDVFIDVVITFFTSLSKYDNLCVISIIRFFQTPDFEQICSNNPKHKESLQKIALKAFHVSLMYGSFFIFDVMKDIKLIYSNLSADEQAMLDIYVNGTITEFDKFISSHPKYIGEDLDLETIRYKMLVLSFVSLAEDKQTVTFAEAMDALKLDAKKLKQLVVKINETEAATVKIDTVKETLIIEHCQPRVFSDKVWDQMADHMHSLIESLKRTASKLQ